MKTEDAAAKLRACRLSAAVGHWAAPAAVLQVEFSNMDFNVNVLRCCNNIWKINSGINKHLNEIGILFLKTFTDGQFAGKNS